MGQILHLQASMGRYGGRTVWGEGLSIHPWNIHGLWVWILFRAWMFVLGSSVFTCVWVLYPVEFTPVYHSLYDLAVKVTINKYQKKSVCVCVCVYVFVLIKKPTDCTANFIFFQEEKLKIRLTSAGAGTCEGRIDWTNLWFPWWFAAEYRRHLITKYHFRPYHFTIAPLWTYQLLNPLSDECLYNFGSNQNFTTLGTLRGWRYTNIFRSRLPCTSVKQRGIVSRKKTLYNLQDTSVLLISSGMYFRYVMTCHVTECSLFMKFRWVCEKLPTCFYRLSVVLSPCV
jgi:hypothetical protein